MPSEAGSLWELIQAAPAGAWLQGLRGRITLADLAQRTCLDTDLQRAQGRSVLLACKDQLTAALALIELDGVARRVVLCTPDLAAAHRPGVIRTAEAELCVRDAWSPPAAEIGIDAVEASAQLRPLRAARARTLTTEWILLTSGTTGAPKLVLHTLATLTAALRGGAAPEPGVVWTTFYDIRRYGGLQIFFRGLLGGALLLSDPQEDVGDFLSRAARAGVTHISGTPSHWRKALMSGLTARLAPRYVRLSGEIADQAVLDGLRAAYPEAIVAHAFASTEAGVAFEVRDGQAGFPAALVGAAGSRIELKVDETLKIRSAGTAGRYLGEGAEVLRAADGFVDTGDRVELRDGRYYFMGRRGGVINVGGLKVHPEEVEAVINQHPWVRMSLVKARRNPITGAVVTADIVLKEGQGPAPPEKTLVHELTERCKKALAAHKVPALIRVVPALEISPSGKLVRPLA